MKFLIVDDHARFRAVLKATLCGPNDHWRECADGAAALPAFAAFRPHWVLMDIEMKPLDGLETLRRLRSGHPDARVVMVSNHDDAELRAEAAQAGACGYVRKDNLACLTDLLAAATVTSDSTKPRLSDDGGPGPEWIHLTPTNENNNQTSKRIQQP